MKNPFKVGDIVLYQFPGFEKYGFFNGKAKVLALAGYYVKIKWLDNAAEQAHKDLYIKSGRTPSFDFSYCCFKLYNRTVDADHICKNKK